MASFTAAGESDTLTTSTDAPASRRASTLSVTDVLSSSSSSTTSATVPPSSVSSSATVAVVASTVMPEPGGASQLANPRTNGRAVS